MDEVQTTFEKLEYRLRSVHPHRCPSCLNFVQTDLAFAEYTQQPDYDPETRLSIGIVSTVFRCGHNKCRALMLAKYIETEIQGAFEENSYFSYELIALDPTEKFQNRFGPEVDKVSSDFSRIYNQAMTAANLGLDDVAGPGLRKALEFLLKDYSIFCFPNQKDEIAKMTLANVIKKFVDHPQLSNTATRAAWLGNDEVHYIRKWVDKDVKSLQKLIDATVAWIELKAFSNSIAAEMPD